MARLNKKKLGIAAAVVFGLAMLWLVSFAVRGREDTVFLGLLLLGIVALQLETYRRLQKRPGEVTQQIRRSLDQQTWDLSKAMDRHYRQIEALSTLLPLIRPRHPLPAMRDWAVSPDFAALVVTLIEEHKPKLIVEASSGVSTLVAGYRLEQAGEGRVVSLEHDANHAAISAANVGRHGLSDRAEVVHAPLKEVALKGKTWLWYDTAALADRGPIDMVIVDGPPMDIQDLARYPALPVLWDRLSEDAILVLDDAARPGEQEIVNRWMQEFPGLEREYHPCEKGAVVLRRKPSAKTAAGAETGVEASTS